jgi:hypothetical protein
VAITLAAPDRNFPPAGLALPAINLFLHDIRENAELRTVDSIVRRLADGTTQRVPPPSRIDCSYVITAWVAPSDNSTVEEHRLLGDVLRVLLQSPVIPAEVLQGALRDQSFLPMGALRSERLRSTDEVWRTLGGQPKATLHYTVTVGLQTQDLEKPAPVVTERVLRIRAGELETEEHTLQAIARSD